MFENWAESNPIYVTRPESDGTITSYSLSVWMSLLAIFITWFNLITWGLIGLYVAGRMII